MQKLSGDIRVGEHAYQLELSLHHGHQIETLNTKFVPHGAIGVVTTLEDVEWLRELTERLWLFEVQENDCSTSPYRGMPLVILSLDEGTAIIVLSHDDNTAQTHTFTSVISDCTSPELMVSKIHRCAQILARKVQGVCFSETPSPEPTSLVSTSVINQVLLSLVSSFSCLDSFFNKKLPMGFK